MASCKKYHRQVEGDDGSIFEPTALEVEAALRHDRRMEKRELKADGKWPRNDMDLDPEHIVFLLENKPPLAGELSFAKAFTSKNELSRREQSKGEEPFAASSGRPRKLKQSEENVLGSDTERVEKIAGPSTTMSKAHWSTTAPSPYSDLETKGPFKLPFALSTPVHRYGGRRAAVCDAFGDYETTAARIRRRVMHKRFPDIQDWLLE